MIVTVTMNPAIDKTVDVPRLECGGLNRISHVEYDAGGKGINVSKTIKELGGKSIATGFLGGNAGRTIQSVLEDWGIENDFVWVDGETRTNTKVVEQRGGVTELNEPGPIITAKQMQQLYEKLEGYAAEDVLFVLAGSIPSGVDKHCYRKIVEMVHGKGAKILLDADGELFKVALDAGPDIIKPNRVELEEYAQFDYHASEEELAQIAVKLHEKGIETIAISMGGEGALFVGKDYEIFCPGLRVEAHSTVGAGDAMVAALAYGVDGKLGIEEMVRTCIATSAGAVTTIGTKPPTREVIDGLKEKVIMERHR
ncbi:MAG: 1-phosphofructokinase [Hespellia sp.]|nr:1-phosphofructokinase [Hespellia sp.]